MRLVAIIIAAACAPSLSSCTSEDPPFGDPGAIEKQNFRGAPGAPSSASGGTGNNLAPFPGPYDQANPPAPLNGQKAADVHLAKANITLAPTLACMGCHKPGDPLSQTKWAFAGYASTAPGKLDPPLANGEVVVTSGTKVIAHVKTSIDGYFWAPADKGPVPADAKTSVRDKDGAISDMVGALVIQGQGSGDCNNANCHGGAQGVVSFKAKRK